MEAVRLQGLIMSNKACWRIRKLDGTLHFISGDEIKFSGTKLIRRKGLDWIEVCSVNEILGKPKVIS